jgi:hypothetical protein
MYEMFSEEGNEAVARALTSIAIVSKDHTKVWNRYTLEQVARPVLEGVAKLHGEIYDTEPRGHIADFLDQLCEENGWAYDPFAYYSW